MKLTKTFIENLRKAISEDLQSKDCDRVFKANQINSILAQDEVSREDIITLVDTIEDLCPRKRSKIMGYFVIMELYHYDYSNYTEEDLVDCGIIERV